MRTILSAAVAGAIGLAPVVLVSSPAYALVDPTYAITTSSTPIVETQVTTGTGNTQTVTRASATVTVTLTSPATADVLVTLANNGTADTAKGALITSGDETRDYDSLITSTDATTDNPESDQITIKSGQSSATKTILIYDDKLDEDPSQFFTVGVASAVLDPTGAATALMPVSTSAASTKVYIADDEPTPKVTVGDAGTVTEGDDLVFPLTLSGASEKIVTVEASTANGATQGDDYGATAGSDYTALTKSKVSIPAGSEAGIVLVNTTDDTDVEASPEKMWLSIAAPVNADLGDPAKGLGKIKDNETAPGVKLSVDAIADDNTTSNYIFDPEGDVGEKKFTINVRLTGTNTSTIPVRLNYDFLPGDNHPTDGENYLATNGKDYKGVAGSLTIPAGTRTATIPVPIIGDTLYEPGEMGQANPPNSAVNGEYFKLVLTSPNGSVAESALGEDNATYFRIKDDEDSSDMPTFSVSNVSVMEGNTGSKMVKFPVTLSAPVDQDTTFTATVDTQNATLDSAGTNSADTPGMGDVSTVGNSGTVTVPAGHTVGYAEIMVNGDSVFEKDEFEDITVALSGTNPLINSTPASGETHTARLTVTNDDTPPWMKFNESSVAEGGSIRVGGTIVGVAQDPYTLGFSVGPQTGSQATDSAPATPGVDFETPEIANFTVPAGKTGTVVDANSVSSTNLANVYLNADDVDEPLEWFTITATETTKIGFKSSTGTFKIIDDADDMPPALAIQDGSINEDEGSIEVPIDEKWLPANAATSTTQTLMIPWWTVDGTAKAGQDYIAAKGTLEVKPGEKPMASVKIIDDKLKESAETFWIKLGVPGPSGTTVERDTGKVTIESDDTENGPAPTISSSASIDGPGTATISGKVPPNGEVQLWGAPIASTKKALVWLATAKAGSSGAYSFKRSLTTAGYRFQTSLDGVPSKEITVKITQDPAFKAESNAKGKVTLTVTSDPKLSGSDVVIYKLSGKKWVKTTWKGTTNSSGVWKATASAAAGSTWTLKAWVEGKSAVGINDGWSDSKKVTVDKK
ncbi:Calx-beta domain-containing protein [Actinoplanes sp. NPDC051851]|uniref:Calx-beta domain-containing protein n=1 Tax=Actinoplanes sp. NPDC051851 TaxID=3154753 RepID=UPI003433DEE5